MNKIISKTRSQEITIEPRSGVVVITVFIPRRNERRSISIFMECLEPIIAQLSAIALHERKIKKEGE